MLNQQEIQKMLKEMEWNKWAEKPQLAEFDNWTKLSSKPNPQTQTFIEITTTTVVKSEP